MYAKPMQQQNLDQLSKIASTRFPKRDNVDKLTYRARQDIKAMREYAAKREGKVREYCTKLADKWQEQLDRDVAKLDSIFANWK